MAAKMIEVQVWILVDSDGDYVIATDQDDVHTKYVEDVSEESSLPKRLVCVTLQVPAPQMVHVKATLPEESAGVSAKVE